jgi:tetratricopeptide (TPR) repeat protein
MSAPQTVVAMRDPKGPETLFAAAPAADPPAQAGQAPRSAAWPLALGLLALLGWLGLQAWSLLQDRQQLQQARQQLQPTIDSAQRVRQTLDRLAADTQGLLARLALAPARAAPARRADRAAVARGGAGRGPQPAAPGAVHAEEPARTCRRARRRRDAGRPPGAAPAPVRWPATRSTSNATCAAGAAAQALALYRGELMPGHYDDWVHTERQRLAALHADTTGQLANWLGGQRLLLVLDNLEQLPQGGATLVLRLLEQVPSAWLLATSRRPCNLAGERLFALRGLPLPTEDGAHNPAVALFVDRAQAIQPGWQPGAAELADVAALVRRLDGLPLALELAASRLPGRSTAQLLQLLDGSADDAPHLQLLSRPGPRAGHDPRPAAIEHVVDWSWQLLSADEQQVLAAVALAHGGCAPALLARWLARPAATVAGCTDALQSHALLRQQPGPDGRARLWAPEPVREFVRQRLDGPSRLALQLALRDVLLAWAQDLGPSPAPQRVEAEIGQVLALLHDGLPPLAPTLQLMLALRSHWDNRGMPAAAQDDLERALDLHQAEGGDPALTGDVHELLAYVRFEAGFAPQARQHARQALQRAGTDPARRARALTRAAWVTLASGRSHDDQAPQAVLLQQQLNEALQLAQRSGDRDAQARALHQLAVLHSHLNHDEARAEALLAQSQALWLALGDRRKAFARLRNRGQCWLAQGRSSDAQACFEQCAQVAADEGDVLGQIDSLLSLSTLLARQRRWQQALDCDRRCLRLCWQHRHRHGLAYALWNPARPLARLRRPEAAMRVMAFAATFWERSFGPLAAADRRTVRQVHRLVRAQLGAARAEALWTDGASLPIADVVALALRD